MKNDFAKYLKGFFTEYLSAERGVSPNTIRSYGAAFASYIDFMKVNRRINAEKLTLEHINRKNTLDFLDWLQTTKNSSVTTRNQRLAAIHAFCRYMQYEDVVHLKQWQEILGIKIKKTIKNTMSYLTLDGIKVLLEQIPRDDRRCRRDLAMLSLLYETGARVQELIDLRPVDVCLTKPCYVTLFGKGSKKRIVPIQDAQVDILDKYMEENNLHELRMNQRPLFQNNRGGKLTGAGITYILNKYAAMARNMTENIIPDKISPHCLRHSKAMHLLQAGVNLVYIRDILGHVSIQTTEVYARADSKQKRDALEKTYVSILPIGSDQKSSWEADPELKSWLKSLGR
ncbi:MAG: tyrosine-type recombinase/integrase [Rikenellaceae bacterium]